MYYEDAFQCFMGTGIDILVIGNYWLDKKNQSENLIDKFSNYQNNFELD